MLRQYNINFRLSNTKKTKTRRPRKRRYESPLRREHTEATSHAILDAAVDLARAGDSEVSFVRIARAAHISTPTVYRHFATKDDLIRALIERTNRRVYGSETTFEVAGLDDLERFIRPFFRRFDDPKDEVHAKRLGVMWEISRAHTVPQRRDGFSRLLDQLAPGVPEPERTHIVDLCIVLASSAMGEALRGYLDSSGDEISDRVLLALRALIEHARTRATRETS